MMGLPSLIGCIGIFTTGLIIGYLAGWGHVAWIDSKRRHEQQQADDAANEAKLAEGRANQQAGFPVHDFDARREAAA